MPPPPFFLPFPLSPSVRFMGELESERGCNESGGWSRQWVATARPGAVNSYFVAGFVVLLEAGVEGGGAGEEVEEEDALVQAGAGVMSGTKCRRLGPRAFLRSLLAGPYGTRLRKVGGPFGPGRCPVRTLSSLGAINGGGAMCDMQSSRRRKRCRGHNR